LIIVEASVNGEKGNFIFDTGAAKLILNSKYYNGGENNFGKSTTGINGQTEEAKYETVKRFQMGGIQKKNINTVILSLNHLERVIEMDVHGLIGYNFFYKYEVIFDYQNQELFFLKTDRKGQVRIKNIYHYLIPPTDSISIKLRKHFPCIDVEIAGQKLRLALDSGAQINLLDEKKIAQIGTHFQENGKVKLVGIDGKKLNVLEGNLSEFWLKDILFDNMRTVIGNMLHLNKSNQTRFDGILGAEFLSKYRIAINYRKKKLYIWDTQKIKTPKEDTFSVLAMLFMKKHSVDESGNSKNIR